MKIKNFCVIYFIIFFDCSWRFMRFLVELLVGSRLMDCDCKMLEMLGYDMELGDSVCWLWFYYLGFFIMLMKCVGCSGMFLMYV